MLIDSCSPSTEASSLYSNLYIKKSLLKTMWDGNGMSKSEWKLGHFLAKRGVMINKPGNGNHSKNECAVCSSV